MSELIDIRDQIPSGYSGRYILDPADIEDIVGHHSVSAWVWNPLTRQYTGQAWNDAVDAPPEAEVAHLLAIDRWHSPPNNDWGGLGYHLAAFASGRRYLVGSLNTARAHVASQNWKYVGLVMIGDFTHRPPSDLHLQAGRECVADMRAFFGRPLAVKAHTVVQLPEYPTSCPGPLWPEWVPLLDKEEGDMATPWERYTGALMKEKMLFEDVRVTAARVNCLGDALPDCWRRSDADPPLDHKYVYQFLAAGCDRLIAAAEALKKRATDRGF